MTIKDVAAGAGVSRATAARVLGDYGYASDDVRARVFATAAELGYEANRLARSMRSGRTQMIGFLCGDIADGVFSAATRGICDVLEAQDYQVMVVNTDERIDQERQGVRGLLAHGVEGIIVSPVLTTSGDHLVGAQEKAAVVGFDRTLDGVTSVVADNHRAAREAVERALAHGHERIAMLASVQPDEPVRLRGGRRRPMFEGPARPSTSRARGFHEALRVAGVGLDPELVVLRSRHHTQAEVDTAVEELVHRGGATAIFAADSYQTLAAFKTLQKMGARIPDDVSLIGFSDADWPALVTPSISIVRQDAYEMGRRAALTLLDQLNGVDNAAKEVVVPTFVQPGDSLGPCRAAPCGG